MPRFGPISRRELIAALRRAGFDGPKTGGKHEIMVRGRQRLAVPNPHVGDISTAMLAGILRQAEITREEWEAL